MLVEHHPHQLLLLSHIIPSSERLYNSKGPELRRCLFSLKQLFQDDKDLVPEFVASEGLTCFIKVGAEADHNYQNYILRGENAPPAVSVWALPHDEHSSSSVSCPPVVPQS
ncbi:hypothetical protein CRENBAI_018067 [Crenichthys baileyi]|uniref:Uncharacterized protein n=1 Tax=Crenichthys baileyi TaxID=28760 RepID=A0AAV9RR45_9TELE